MKKLHRPDLYGWSRFDESRNIDFHSYLWQNPGFNVAVDPLPLTAHDERHLAELGGAQLVVVTNSDHVRDVARFVELTGARVAGPRAEQHDFPFACQDWLADGDRPRPGLEIVALEGSKTPGELALLVTGSGGKTLITGDLVRAHQGGSLNLLPDAKLSDKARARASVRRLLEQGPIEAVLPGDGWPVFRDGQRALSELLESLGA
jgi:hypothetical protein